MDKLAKNDEMCYTEKVRRGRFPTAVAASAASRRIYLTGRPDKGQASRSRCKGEKCYGSPYRYETEL